MNHPLPLRAARGPTLALTIALLMFAARTAAQPDPKSPAPPPPAPAPRAQSTTPHPGMIALGTIAVGLPAPDFELDGSDGHPTRLFAMRGRWVLLVFADRKDSIAALARIEPGLTHHGIRLVGVCNEKARVLEQFWGRAASPPLMLADVTGEVSAIYGLRDPVNSSTLPGYVLVDPRGVVQIALLGRTLPLDPLIQLVIETVESS